MLEPYVCPQALPSAPRGEKAGREHRAEIIAELILLRCIGLPPMWQGGE
jgi:hypothetical protein